MNYDPRLEDEMIAVVGSVFVVIMLCVLITMLLAK